MIKAILTFFCFLSLTLNAFQYNLSIVAIFQDEAPYLKEWIDYHLEKGVDHFWLYNNNSKDNFLEILRPYLIKKIVHIIDWPSKENGGLHFFYNVQSPAYSNALKKVRGKTKWLAIIDIDEFIVPIKYKNIYEMLEKDYSPFSGLSINWQCYGTSGITKVPQGQTLKYLTMKMKWDDPWNKNSKTIVQPLHVKNCPSPHYCSFIDGHYAVDANFNRCDVCPNVVNIDKIRINHYWSRDEDYLYNNKLPRYRKWIGEDKELALLEHAERMNYEYDPILAN